MKALTAILVSLTILSAMATAAPTPPAKVAKILKAIADIRKDERRDDLFKRLGLWDDDEIQLIDSDSGLGQRNEIWDLSGDGRWLLTIVSYMRPNELSKDARGGTVAGFQVGYRETVTKKIDWKTLKRLEPYYEAGKVHPEKSKAESGPRD